MRRPPFLLVLLLLAAAFLAATVTRGTAEATRVEARAPTCRTVARPKPRQETRKPPTTRLDARRSYDVVVATSCGSFTIRLDVKDSPRLAASFVSLARSGFYDHTIFHRIVPGFVIQGGDPTQTGDGTPGYQTVDKVPPKTRYVEGVVAMAKTQTDPAGASGSQFFVVTGADVGLPPIYALLGRVTRGIAVVRLIGKLGDPTTQLPTRVITIDRVSVKES